MKKLITITSLMLLSIASFAQNPTSKTLDPNKKVLKVDASCGQCKFKMKGDGCTLAVRMNGKSYFVDKSNIEDYGDAHAKTGFCNASRKAKVQGEVGDNKGGASYFERMEK